MNFVGLDIETTGLHFNQGHRLIQIGASFHRNACIYHDVKPYGHIVYDPEAMDVNKFTQARVLSAQPQQLVDEIMARTFHGYGVKPGQLTAVGWNVGSFDLPFIQAELPRTAAYFSHRVVDLTGIAMFMANGRDDWRKIKDNAHEEIEKILGYAGWHDAGYDSLAAILTWDRWSQQY